jgi:two-component system, LytTR family, sensor kinase
VYWLVLLYFFNFPVMLNTKFEQLIVLVLFSSLMLVAGLYLLANYNRLFRSYIKSRLLRQNLVVWMIGLCLIFSLTPTNPEFYQNFSTNKLPTYFLIQSIAITAMVLFVFNITWFVSELSWLKKLSFRKRMGIILSTIISCTMLIGIPINYLGNHGSFKNIEFSFLFNFYTGCITGLIYITMSYLDIERQKKLNEKELELSRLRELKAKAELDALHSKINPHFLYNALNSIADLSVTDGKKARKMTIALSDLFRYSINYSNNNYSTVRDEVEMANVYLQIEKIRFEDKLSYSLRVDEELSHYLVPRFVLQPLVENAVKHGLKATGQMTEISIEVKKSNNGLVLNITDTGPDFPTELNPGYGVKSVYDKLDLLFPGNYEMYFSNHPVKQVSLYIHKLAKDESAI